MRAYASLMTTTTDRMADRMLALLETQPANVQARYESKIVEARKGTLTDALAMQIMRQVAGMSSPAETEPARKLPSNPSGDSSSNQRSNDASEAQARYAADLLRTRLAANERVVGTVKTAAELLAAFDASGRM